MAEKKRKVDLVVISDVHLGTYGCHAKELVQYLKTISPKRIILNGDIIDMWQFQKRYWPKDHMQVVTQLLKMSSKGIKVYYITGNHDEMLRKFVGFKMGSLRIVNKVVLKLNGKKAWFFHGDVFDVTMQHSKWLTKMGAIGYDILIVINNIVNFFSLKLGKGKVSLSKRIKNSVKSAVKFINNFEQTAAEIAISNGYEYVVCGHIHQPVIKQMKSDEGNVTYLNSGDWVENLTALEYNNGGWDIYSYKKDPKANKMKITTNNKAGLKNKELFQRLVEELNITAA